MVAPAAGGSVLAQFDAILAAAASELAGRVRATAFDVESGRLDVVPDAPAVGTQRRWSAPKLIAAANAAVSGANVRAVHVLASAPAVPVERRTPPDGYRRALEARRQAVVPSRVVPGIAQTVERQNRAMREISRRAFPEPPAVPDDALAPIDQARVQRHRQAAATEAACTFIPWCFFFPEWYGWSAAMRSIGGTVPSRITYAFFRTVVMACSRVGASAAGRSTASRLYRWTVVIPTRRPAARRA